MSKIGTATNKKVIELYNMLLDGTLILQPSFQRKLVWNNTHKENFIDTILGGYPFPEVYFADGEIDLQKRKSQTVVVDGQQRLNTIYQYITNDSELVLKRIKRFENLTDKQKTDFYDYNVVVRDLGRITIEQIKEIFNRINSVQYALNAMEINNALYEGEFIATAKEIICSNDLKDLEVFGDTDVSRMKDLEFIALIMTTIEMGGYFTGDREVESSIKQNDDSYPNKELMKNMLVKILAYLKELELPLDSLWLRKSSLYTLICELAFYTNEKKDLPPASYTREILLKLESEIIDSRNKGLDNDYNKFYTYIFQGTTSRRGRIIRGEVLRATLNP